MALSKIASSSSSTPQFKYDVFLSFRGEDTRYNFTSHLHKALRDKEIITFIDDELNRGDEISPSLLKAIEESQISIIIFSEHYADSRWCLEELAKILECKKRYRQIVIPVFYNVCPSDVRNQTGTYGDAFTIHEKRFSENLEKVQIWKDALKEAANLSGWHSSIIKPEAELIENIVKHILERLPDISSSDGKNLVGIDSKIEHIVSLLATKEVCRVGIWGTGGIGKTTLAKAIFNKIRRHFEGSYFAQNVREESEQSGGSNSLREKLYSAVLREKNVDMGTSSGERRLGRRKLLIVFDDVTDFQQIEYLIGSLDCLSSQSRIIITSRDKQVFNNCGVNCIYEVKELNHNDALELFCQYGFKQNQPTADYIKLSKRVLPYAGGLPLALKVLGASLCNKRKEVWESAIKKLEKILDKDIYKVLKISYDGLNDNQQDIFLEIACFLKGRDIHFVKLFLNACGFFTDVEISGLVDKSLIVISSYNTITMHDLLQAMGREIVRQQSIEDPGQRSRLWHHEDIYRVLTKNMGSKAIQGISFDMSKTKDIDLNPCAFTKMQNLRFLEFYCSNDDTMENKVHISEGFDFALDELRYLHWDGCPIKSLQSNFYPEHLVILRMQNSNIKQLWNGVLQLVNLKEIDLRGSKHLISCPDLSGARNLEQMDLNECTSLLELPSSFQYLSKLTDLSLMGCKSLRGLPDCFSGLKSLKRLHLNNCTSLKLLPEMPCNIEWLDLCGAAIEEVSPAIGTLSKLSHLNLGNCFRLKSIPSSICELKSLDSLYLANCTKIDKLLDGIGTLKSLWNLNVVGPAIREVPSSIVHLSNPQTLSCNQNLNLFMLALSGLCNLRTLHLADCGITVIPDSLGHLSQLQRLYLGGNNFESIPASIINLSKLEYLDINFCERLLSLPELPSTSIYADNCFSLASVPLLKSERSEFCVWFRNCSNLQNGLDDIVEEILLKLPSAKGYLWGRYGEDTLYESPAVSICFPGSEVPERFSFRSTGSLITKELPPGWNNNFVGFAVCAVVETQHHQIDGAWALEVVCERKLKSKDGQSHTIYRSWDQYASVSCVDYYFESDHLYIGGYNLESCGDIDDLCSITEVTFQFYLEFRSRRIECCKVKSCGVRLMYARGPGKSNRSFNLGEREDEPHPKRLKSVELL